MPVGWLECLTAASMRSTDAAGDRKGVNRTITVCRGDSVKAECECQLSDGDLCDPSVNNGSSSADEVLANTGSCAT